MIRLPLLFLAAFFASISWAGLTNQLAHHPSPYLALHGEDPVQWQDWSQAVLDQARAENKLIYISSGYFACHWCHVMQRESYQDPAIAKVLNEYFIPVKIDRELQPALDAHLIDFVQRTRGHAGWPLNVFLTPEGYPVVGLTYAPANEFGGLLQRVTQIWKDKYEELKVTARTASKALLKQEQVPQSMPIDGWDLHVRMVTMALVLGDDMEGGFGSASRFPMAPQWSVLLERIEQYPDDKMRELVELTLDKMATQGMRDHLGGGFFRYTVDSSWQVPHFEKMLYTQAQLSRLYMQAARVLQRPDYLEVARNTLDFTLDVLAGMDGGYIASLSAIDPFDAEGGGYLWTQEQLAQALVPEELIFAKARWGLDEGSPTTEDGYLPVDETSLKALIKPLGLSLDQLRTLEQRVTTKLLKVRMPRNHPRDDKQLAAWNGLMLSALGEAVTTFPEQKKYREAGSRLRDYLVNKLWNGEQLFRAEKKGDSLGDAALEDYVFIAVALNDWASISGADADRILSKRLISEAWKRFYKEGGWQTSDSMLIPGLATEQVMSDGPLPSPAALLTDLTLTLGSDSDKLSALQALNMSYPAIIDQPVWYATHARTIINHTPVANRKVGSIPK